ncbi:MAG: hypothetical protein AAF986_10715 [Pseudomonadota bacterium]
MLEILMACAFLGAFFVGARMLLQEQGGDTAHSCDLRRSIVIIGTEQNSPDCVSQRRALQPLLMRLRNAGINVVEIYGERVPRRNGQTLEWLDSDALRRNVGARHGFHLICLDNEAEIILRGRQPVSEAVLSEMIAGEERVALPSPIAASPAPSSAAAPKPPKPTPAPSNTPWSVGVLR